MTKYWIAVCACDAIVFATFSTVEFTVEQLNEKTNWGAVQILPMVVYENKNIRVPNMTFPGNIPLIE